MEDLLFFEASFDSSKRPSNTQKNTVKIKTNMTDFQLRFEISEVMPSSIEILSAFFFMTDFNYSHALNFFPSLTYIEIFIVAVVALNYFSLIVCLINVRV